MRPLRLLAPCDPENGFPVLYHITSRVVEKQFIFGDAERAKFLKLAKDYAVFSGFELVSWCVMSNHFHLLVRVPVQDVEAISDQEMVERLSRILNPKRINQVVERLNRSSTAELRRQVLADFRKRIGHLPSYVKAVKQEFTQWFNHKNQREGTLWEGRYHSTLIEDCGGEDPASQMNGVGEIARVVASYIDMNPVRAGLESDPKDSTWSSYGAALGGDATALRGLRLLWGLPHGGMAGYPEMEHPGEKATRKETTCVQDGQFLEIHREWLLRGQVAQDDATHTIDDRNPGDDTPAPSGFPPLPQSGLRRVRLLGSPGFLSRFGLAAFSQQI